MQTLFLLSALVAVLSVGMFVLLEIAVARAGNVQPLKESEFDGVLAKRSVVIPARNEEEDIDEAFNRHRIVTDVCDAPLQATV